MIHVDEALQIIRCYPPGDYEVRAQGDQKVLKNKAPWHGTLERWIGGKTPKALFRRSGVTETFTWVELYLGAVQVRKNAPTK
jgi:hypothetical protein